LKTALINGSPKIVMQKSDPCASHALLLAVRRSLRHNHIHDTEDFHVKTGTLSQEELDELFSCDVWIFSFPLYSAGIPSHFLRFMLLAGEYARKKAGRKPVSEEITADPEDSMIHVYAVVNCGLYEGNEARPVLEMLEQWCESSGFAWGSGVGVGGGMAFANSHILSLGIRKWHSLGRVLSSFAVAVAGKMSAGNFYCSPNVSKKFYVSGMNRYLRKRMKNNN